MGAMCQTVAEFIKEDPVTIRSLQSARAAAKLMRDRGTAFLVVLDGEGVLGVVTSLDLAVRVLAANETGAMRIDAACTLHPLVAAPADPLEDVLEQMQERGVVAVPIVEDGQLVGVFSADDVGAVPVVADSASEPREPVVTAPTLPGNVRTLLTGKALPTSKPEQEPALAHASA